MGNPSAVREVIDEVRETGLLPAGSRVVAMLSGGADSVCLLHAAREVLGPQSLVALHVNHGLRPAADGDERFCLELCERLGIEVVAERVSISPRGNVEALAREARYRAAEAVRERAGCDLIATGHTASDQVETILYRLVTSPGRRALSGMSGRRDRLVRPLLGLGRDQTRAYCEEAGLPWVDDETNADTSLARNRLRHQVLPALREIHPAADANLLATAAQLRDESEVLEAAVERAAGEVGAGGVPPAVEAARLAQLQPAVRRLLLRRLAEDAAGGPLPLSDERVRELEQLARGGGTRSLDLGDGVAAVSEYGVIRFRREEPAEAPDPVALPVPGSCVFGAWELLAEPVEPTVSGSFDEPLLDAEGLTNPLTVRSWRDGDRISPLGLNGSKSLQDVFTDRKIPRSLRRTLPVVESNGEIVWVAGVAISEKHKITPATKAAVRLRAKTL